jgi:type II secretory pathway component PulF
LTEAGIVISDALPLAARIGGGAGPVLRHAAAAVARGGRLSAALADAAALSPADAALLEAGERTGALEHTLSLLAHRLEHAAGVWSRLLRTLAYPFCLLTLTFVVIAAMGAFVLPAFAELYAGAGVPLPLVTRALLAFGTFTVGHVGAVALSLAVAIAMIGALGRSRAWRRLCDRALLHTPFVGTTLSATVRCEIYAALSALLGAGVELDRALELVAPVASSSVMRARIERARALVSRGSMLSVALLRSKLDPNGEDAALVRVAEATGDYAGCFARMSRLAAAVRDERIAALARMLEPAAVAVMAVGVTATVLGVYQPILGATEVLLGNLR